VFPSKVGTHLQGKYVLKHFHELCEQCGLPRLRIYDLRHTMATYLLASGHNVREVSARLGHSTATHTLNTYAHVLPGTGKKLADTMQRLLRKAKRKPKSPAPAKAPRTPANVVEMPVRTPRRRVG
jgi:integrase